jgi:hypothetical protein
MENAHLRALVPHGDCARGEAVRADGRDHMPRPRQLNSGPSLPRCTRKGDTFWTFGHRAIGSPIPDAGL